METRKIWQFLKWAVLPRRWWEVQMSLQSPYEVTCRKLNHDGPRLLLCLKAGEIATFIAAGNNQPEVLCCYVKAVDQEHALYLTMPMMTSQLQEFLNGPLGDDIKDWLWKQENELNA